MEVHGDIFRKPQHSKLLAMIASLGYRTYLVNEQCGYNLDCRNLICFPLERLPPASLLAGAANLSDGPGTGSGSFLKKSSANDGMLFSNCSVLRRMMVLLLYIINKYN